MPFTAPTAALLSRRTRRRVRHATRRVVLRIGAWVAARPVSRKIAALPVVAAVGFAAVLAIAVGLGVTTQRHLAALRHERYPALESARQQRDLLEATQAALLDAVSGGDAERLQVADSLARTFTRLVAAAPGGDAAARARRAALARQHAAYYASARRASQALLDAETGDPAHEAIARMVAHHGALRDTLVARVAREGARIEREFDRTGALQTTMWGSVVSATVVALGLLGVLALATTRGIVRPLVAAIGVAERLAAGGARGAGGPAGAARAPVTFPAAGRDEVGQLLRALRVMLAHLRAADAELRAREARFRGLVEQSSDVILVVGPTTDVRYVSDSVVALFGYPPAALLGQPASRLLHPEDAPEALATLAGVLAHPGATVRMRCRVRHADSAWRNVEIAATNRLADPVIDGVVLNVRDVTERAELEAELQRRAFHDALTGLANRALFRDRVEQALGADPREPDLGPAAAVLFLDLDGFKGVNDSLGHEAGDRLLVAVADRLRNATRGIDTVARFGGDEFAILLEQLHAPEDATTVAERITAAMRAPVRLAPGPRAPVPPEGGEARVAEARVGVSIGIAFAEPGLDADALLRNADAAMYHAKAGGKGRHAAFDPALVAAASARVDLEAELARALAGGTPGEAGFALAYQPVVALADGGVRAVEALLRWRHPTRGPMAPAKFIPAAEESGLIVELGRWVLEEACREAATWPAVRGGALVGVTVNVSGRQLREPDFAAQVAAVLAGSGLAPGRLTLEITESVLLGGGPAGVADVPATLERLRALKALGVRLAIDDFGTGYSSLAYLQQFPVDVLKIDKRFVDGVARGATDAALTRTVVALGAMLELKTVAEGVETPEQRRCLTEMGCELGQGYLFARPLAPDALHAFIAEAADATVAV